MQAQAARAAANDCGHADLVKFLDYNSSEKVMQAVQWYLHCEDCVSAGVLTLNCNTYTRWPVECMFGFNRRQHVYSTLF